MKQKYSLIYESNFKNEQKRGQINKKKNEFHLEITLLFIQKKSLSNLSLNHPNVESHLFQFRESFFGKCSVRLKVGLFEERL